MSTTYQTISLTLKPHDRKVTFRLNRRTELLGDVEIDHWWLPTSTIHSSPRSRHQNFEAIHDSFWQLCRKAKAHRTNAVAESYLLARLTPMMRSIGSRRVVADARLKQGYAEIGKAAHKLNKLLRTDPLHPISAEDFQRQTKGIVGPRKLSDEERRLNYSMCDELLDGPVCLLRTDREAAVKALESKWQVLNKRIGRRSGRDSEKWILDILSYEARTSLYRCYSSAWEDVLIPYVKEHYKPSPETVRFLGFWHVLQWWPHTRPSYFHLFHGHTSALHPAGSEFIHTSKGKDLLESLIQKSYSA